MKDYLNILTYLLALLISFDAVSSVKSAKTFYQRRDYERAAEAFYSAYKSASSIKEKRKAEWGLAESLQKIGLYYSSSKYYSLIVRRGKGDQNPFFRSAFEELGRINAKINLGQAHIVQLFKAKVKTSDVPRRARGFYFYYKGIEAFNAKRYEKAASNFSNVPSISSYYTGSMFYRGVIANLAGRHSSAINFFEKVLAATRSYPYEADIREMALMNIARINYEKKRFPQAVSYYGQIPRDSENWLDALWESSWAFFFMQKFNNTLGNIHTLHSPFFSNRFYPESYILSAISYLRLCRYDSVKDSMRSFKTRYSPVFRDIKGLLNSYKGNSQGLFKLVYDYVYGRSSRFPGAEEIIRKLSKMDSFKGARDTVRFADRELDILGRYRRWYSSGLYDEVKSFLNSKKSAAVSNSGKLMYAEATNFYNYLRDLSSQTKLILAEMQLGRLAKLRSLIYIKSDDNRVEFIGGLQQLKLNQTLEYWPFEGEYWEDELGFYVYNLDSLCRAGK
jgi:tetratricopeptide (TPR) repeat protein